MPYLIIDTSSTRPIAAIVLQDTCTWKLNTSISTADLIDELSHQLPLQLLDNLKGVFVGLGPGSYTGLRVGLTFCKTFAYAKHLPLKGVCSLNGLIPSKKGRFLAVRDAKAGGFYVRQGVNKENIDWISDPQQLSLDDFLSLAHTVDFVVTDDGILLEKITDPEVLRKIELSEINIFQLAFSDQRAFFSKDHHFGDIQPYYLGRGYKQKKT